MLGNGADPDIKDDYGKTALDYGRTDEEEIVINYIKNFAANIKIVDASKRQNNLTRSIKQWKFKP